VTSRWDSEAGFTLVELLLAIVVLSIGAVAVLGALRLDVNFGRMQRNLSTAELALGSFAEHVKAESYIDCAFASDYIWPSAPAGVTATIVEVAYLRNTAFADGKVISEDDFDVNCGPGDPDEGLQLVRLRVDSSGATAALETAVIKRSA
jgi:prepilin-type N-terminal cleavage/methylation domain-containing protein